PLVVQSNRPALVCATATSAVPPSAPPGTTTSHEPSAAIVTLTVRAGRPGFCRLYVATNRLSRAAATRAASCPQGAVGAVGTAVADGVSSGRTGGCEVHPARAAQPSTAVVVSRVVRPVRTRVIVADRSAGSWDRLSRPAIAA